MEKYYILILLFPLAGFLFNILIGRFISPKVVSWAGVLSILGSLVVALFAIAQVFSGKTIEYNIYTWILSDDLKVSFGYLIDQLTAVMLFVVCFVGWLIHIYSVGYMHGDPGYPRYFAYLNLFVFSMLMLVMGNNLVMLYFGWEAVGLCSYFLIGFWYHKKTASDAGKKAFIVNRIGDFGFALGIFLLFINVYALNYTDIFPKIPGLQGHTLNIFGWNIDLITLIALLLFCGAVGKSAQIPLHVWLPDAMEGPTPVSALIHAATMVTAGVFMVARLNPIYGMSEIALAVVAITGAVTSFFAATIALVQRDMKRIIAYSTISQIGYMFIGCGMAAYGAGIFHLYTHAFFKALLFMGAGSVMHAMAGELDIYKMGGLRKKMPITYITFLIASLTIAGIPGFSGFFSKDEILWAAFASAKPYGKFIWLLGTITAALTAFYTFRILFVAFHGKFRGTPEEFKHVHESPPIMTVPLIVLAIGSVIVGYFSIPHFLEPVIPKPVFAAPHEQERVVMTMSIIAGVTGILIAGYIYIVKSTVSARLAKTFSGVYKVLWNKYYVDELYSFLFVKPTLWIAEKFIERFADIKIIEGIVNGIPKLIYKTGLLIRPIQTGQLQQYAIFMIAGIIIFVLIILNI
ncbi:MULTISPECIES: NADH-quinone oxidoreductase subunit L [Thermodesulfovibrio]|uniref:NADH-quinone oxidoreductase chain l n=2 Tax=Thermodesulfovibrio yellowstonii TaxID=28262 RepID=B5YKJ0_THEYD|nr:MULTISPECIES: NADH-quinone oxidoreductase subunit L [Thermodesulfovibrio]ACI21670.1 NADH-quinone oxidoreductase chain l [Thermodesulfovibrio yellowstonii DSM 11347]MDI6865639.1 NADH-quinone oxidoreductase subunit L [Thermodesulfovibrio yellowstonii]GLI53461.1 NADH-quinone oxidoreductase subunit L [Thermodesulfovibrio islandicus]